MLRDLLNDVPIAVLVLGVVALVVAAVLLAVWLLRRLVPPTREGFDAEVSSQILGSIAALFGLLLAFVIVVEFQTGLGFADLDAVYRGKEGWRRFAQTWQEAWEHITVRVERIEDLDDGIVALLTFDGTGRGSGVEVSVRVGHVATVTEGRMSKLVSIAGWEEALEAVGLRE